MKGPTEYVSIWLSPSHPLVCTRQVGGGGVTRVQIMHKTLQVLATKASKGKYDAWKGDASPPPLV